MGENSLQDQYELITNDNSSIEEILEYYKYLYTTVDGYRKIEVLDISIEN